MGVSWFMSWVLWFTGLPGCGKTTIAKGVKAGLEERGIKVKVLELDEIRRVITPNPTYSDQERDVVYASLAYMAKLLSEAGTNVRRSVARSARIILGFKGKLARLDGNR